MSSLPSEVLEDVLLPLHRWTLDDVQFTDRRFLRLILERMSDVCLRQIESAHFDAPNANAAGSYVIRISSQTERQISNSRNDAALLF
ncbi:hypothetical protein AAVH_09490 [Aphelenchoides avenae]|nr:hypothetical protein AAVH_09490 [Aphelenchus avenae]